MADKPEALVVTPHVVTSASVGTALATGAGTITAFTMNQPTSASADDLTPLVLLDTAAAPVGFVPTLFAASLRALACLYEPRPGVALTPGDVAPTWPKSLGGFPIPFSNGCFVQSCPANVTFTVSI